MNSVRRVRTDNSHSDELGRKHMDAIAKLDTKIFHLVPC